MSTTNGTMKSFKVTDKDGNVYIMTPVDAIARSAASTAQETADLAKTTADDTAQTIEEAKYIQFDDEYFKSEVSQDGNEVNIGLNGVPFGVEDDSPLKFVQDTHQGIVLGSDAPFSFAIAPEYDDTTTYPNIGTAVMYKGLRYVSNTAITAAEVWTPAHWDESDVESVIGNVEALLAAL